MTKHTGRRYQLVLLPCEATSREWWGRVVGSADRLADVFRDTRCGYLALDQAWHVEDTRTGRVISQEEFYQITDST